MSETKHAIILDNGECRPFMIGTVEEIHHNAVGIIVDELCEWVDCKEDEEFEIKLKVTPMTQSEIDALPEMEGC